jgi:hypothetical protein
MRTPVPPEHLRRLAGSTIARRELIANDELVSVQNQFAVHDLIAGRFNDSVYFFGAKDTFVEIERGVPVMHDQFGDELVLSMHGLLR